MKVDYTDPDRIENTLLRSNVKVINPNTTSIYSCPVLLPGHKESMSVFVVPRSLDIRVGDVISSAQAGGVMHNVNMTTDTGKTLQLSHNCGVVFIDRAVAVTAPLCRTNEL